MDNYLSPSAVVGDPREDVSNYVRTREFTPNTVLALRTLINDIGTETALHSPRNHWTPCLSHPPFALTTAIHSNAD